MNDNFCKDKILDIGTDLTQADVVKEGRNTHSEKIDSRDSRPSVIVNGETFSAVENNLYLRLDPNGSVRKKYLQSFSLIDPLVEEIPSIVYENGVWFGPAPSSNPIDYIRQRPLRSVEFYQVDLFCSDVYDSSLDRRIGFLGLGISEERLCWVKKNFMEPTLHGKDGPATNVDFIFDSRRVGSDRVPAYFIHADGDLNRNEINPFLGKGLTELVYGFVKRIKASRKDLAYDICNKLEFLENYSEIKKVSLFAD